MKKTLLTWLCIAVVGGLTNFAVAQSLASANRLTTYHADTPPQDESRQLLADVLEELQNQHQVLFNYEPDVVEGKQVKKLTEPTGPVDVEEMLQQYLAPLRLDYKKLRDNYYVIFRMNQPKVDKVTKQPVQSGRLPVNHLSSLTASLRPQPLPVSAYVISVGGTVTDLQTDEPIPGVNVLVKGASTGTITDVEGNFRLDVPSEESILVFSSIGYTTEEVTVGSQTTIDVALAPSLEQLSEVVVIGFGTQEREDVTGAISSVSGEELNDIPVPSFEQALTGRAAGVQVTTSSGAPGAGANIRVRGVGSTNNAEPLYVIDGIIIGNATGNPNDGQAAVSPLSLINPNDIESIDILKDASATAIYGARAGNGVVIITTKRGKEGQMQLNFDAYTAWNVLDQSNFNMLSGPQWAQYTAEVNEEAGLTEYPGQPFINEALSGADLPTYDWFDQAYRNGRINSYNLSLNAGSEKSQYFTSIGYFDQEGILPNSDLERYTVRFNSDHQVSERIKFGNTLALSRSEANTIGNVNANSNTRNWITRLLGANPYKPIYDAQGNYAGLTAQDPLAEAQLDYENNHTIETLDQLYDHETRNRIWGSLFADVELIDGLVFHTMGSIDYSFNKDEARTPANMIDGAANRDQTTSSLNLRSRESRTWFVENTLRYEKEIGNHNFSIMAGYQAQNNLNQGFNSSAGAFVDTDYWFFDRPQLTNEITDSEGNILVTNPLVFPSVGNFENESAFVSVFGRIIYDLQDKYLLTATVRRDGSSRFGSEQRWGTFPAVSVGWRVSEEGFMSGIESVSNLKLRAGYGISGSDNTELYQWNSVVSSGGNQEYVFNGGPVPGTIITRLANPLLAWEEIKMLNVGVDVGLLAGRLEFTVDYFNKTTDGLLLPFTPAAEVGSLSNPSGNLGRVDNSGLELAVNSVNVANSNLTWTTNFNISAVRNEVVSLPEDADRFSGFNITRVGEEIGALYGFEANGLFQNWNEVYDHAYQNQSVSEFDQEGNPIYSEDTDQTTANTNTAPGDIRFVDQNDDGIIDADNDRVIIGSTIPDFTWGMDNTVRYRGLSLSVFLQGVHGIELYNDLRVVQERATGGWANKRATVLDRWTGEGTSNSVPRAALNDPNSNQRASSHWVEDGSFVRIKNVRLAYTLPTTFMERLNLDRLGVNIYAVGTNLFTFTEYTGFDPEIGLRESNNPETAGVDAGLYPLTRQYTVGLKLSF